jgi:hypothetical protein
MQRREFITLLGGGRNGCGASACSWRLRVIPMHAPVLRLELRGRLRSELTPEQLYSNEGG